MAILNSVKATLIIRNDTAANWGLKNPILSKGELALEIDTNLMKAGDGITSYSELPYLNTPPIYIDQALSQKVNKSGDTITGALSLNYVPSNAQDAVNKEYVDNLILTAGLLRRSIVENLPSAEEADPNVIYMIKDDSTIGPDYYKEYMLIDGEMAQIGDTSVNLTDYIRKPNVFTVGNLFSIDSNGELYDLGISADDISGGSSGPVNINDVEQNPEDIIVFNCGTSTTVI